MPRPDLHGFVQVGAFRNQQEAESQRARVAMLGIAALGSNAGAWNQRILLNSDIDCICENSVCAACNAVLSSWYWLNASA